jgi:two-component system, OmpR family, phosphate regulon response regulator PhoB
MGERIVVVEDEAAIALPLVDRLEQEGFDVVHASDGRAGLAAAEAEGVALVVLDLMLPALNGTDVLAQLREQGNTVPVICLTARTGERDRVEHLVAGADDYVTKPFSLDELVARVRAILRRTAPSAPAGTVRIGDLVIDLEGHTVRRGERVEKLSTLEAAILACLLENRGRATSRTRILDVVWGRYAAVTDRTIDFHVKNLRRKIEERPDQPTLIVTDHGVGYRFAG